MRESVRTLWPYLRRYRRGVGLGVGALVIKDLAAAISPIMIRNGIDSLSRQFRFETAIYFCLLLLALSAIKGVFQYWMRVILIGISRDIEYDLRSDLFRRLVSLSSDFYARMRTGDIMARATNDLSAVRMMLGPGVMYSADTMLTLVLGVAIMAWVDWPLTIVALLPAPLVSLAVILFGRVIHDRFERIQAMFSDISSRVQENLAGVRVIRAYVQEDAELLHFEQLNRDYIDQNLKLARTSSMFLPLLQALVGITFLIVLWVGGYRLLTHHITLGSFVMFNLFMGMMIWPMIALGWVVNLMQRGTASLGRINQILNERPSIAEPERPAALPEPFRGEIEFREVSVEYPSGKALDGVSFRVRAGETVAMVGHTGSGKSTLVKLIPRLMDPTSGTVLVDGIDVRELSPSALRRQIGFVPQETFLFSATLAENIALGVEDASEDEIRKAADLAGLTPDIAAFPKGYQTMVGERGITLSGGQKQRTAIARAVLRNPGILILDDALASVDTVTEERILSGLGGVMRGRTTILISHRVSTVRQADRILVLSSGRIVEQGTHAELIRAHGYYADLYQKQLLEEELEAI
jgi:ATP-binding cassette, subfamily B, multidrug efflux pump